MMGQLVTAVATAALVMAAGCGGNDAGAPAGPGSGSENGPAARPTSGAAAQPAGDVAAVRKIVADVLNRDVGAIDVAKPLGTYGANNLDCVEIVMEIEDAFQVVIPDEELNREAGGTGTEAYATGLTVEKLAAIVARVKAAK